MSFQSRDQHEEALGAQHSHDGQHGPPASATEGLGHVELTGVALVIPLLSVSGLGNPVVVRTSRGADIQGNSPSQTHQAERANSNPPSEREFSLSP